MNYARIIYAHWRLLCALMLTPLWMMAPELAQPWLLKRIERHLAKAKRAMALAGGIDDADAQK